jgi:hypothetical protein
LFRGARDARAAELLNGADIRLRPTAARLRLRRTAPGGAAHLAPHYALQASSYHSITQEEIIMARVNFDTYKYFVYSNRYDTIDDAATIQLYNGELLVAILFFNYDASKANRDPVLFGGDRVFLYYHMSMLDTIIDMLRNEEPVYLYYNIDRQLGYLSTSKEEVGEEET